MPTLLLILTQDKWGLFYSPGGHSIVSGEIFNFYKMRMRGGDSTGIQFVGKDSAKHPKTGGIAAQPAMEKYLIQNLNSAAVEKFCSSIYQNVSYFNINDCNITFLNSALHSLLMCRYQNILFFPSLLQGRIFPTVCYMFILSVSLISTAQHLLSPGFHGKKVYLLFAQIIFCLFMPF